MAETKKTTTTKETKLNPNIWQVPFNGDLIAQVLYVYMSNERKGTSNAKTRGDVSGGGRKPWKQKGTGRARSGSIRSPLWVGGGVTFVPNDKNWSKKINKGMAKKATCVMLSERLRNENLEFVNIAEKQSTELRKSIEKYLNKSLLVVSNNEQVQKSLRNIPSVSVRKATVLNAKHIANAKNVLIDEEIVKILEERLTNEK